MLLASYYVYFLITLKNGKNYYVIGYYVIVCCYVIGCYMAAVAFMFVMMVQATEVLKQQFKKWERRFDLLALSSPSWNSSSFPLFLISNFQRHTSTALNWICWLWCWPFFYNPYDSHLHFVFIHWSIVVSVSKQN